MAYFQNVLLSYRLHELNTIGVRDIWSSKRYNRTYTEEKLDRVLATKEALCGLPESFCEALPAIKSDHSL